MGAVITQAGCIVVSVLIYLPFVKVASRRAEQAQLEAMQQKQAATA
jgi:PTS system cellobiose-specific IIC component